MLIDDCRVGDCVNFKQLNTSLRSTARISMNISSISENLGMNVDWVGCCLYVKLLDTNG